MIYKQKVINGLVKDYRNNMPLIYMGEKWHMGTREIKKQLILAGVQLETKEERAKRIKEVFRKSWQALIKDYQNGMSMLDIRWKYHTSNSMIYYRLKQCSVYKYRKAPYKKRGLPRVKLKDKDIKQTRIEKIINPKVNKGKDYKDYLELTQK